MNLTPTEQEHYDAIDKLIEIHGVPLTEEERFQLTRLAQACAKITEREKLKAQREIIWQVEEKVKYLGEGELFNILNEEKEEIKQQLNELGK